MRSVLTVLSFCCHRVRLVYTMCRPRLLFVPRFTRRLENNGKSRIRLKYSFAERKIRDEGTAVRTA